MVNTSQPYGGNFHQTDTYVDILPGVRILQYCTQYQLVSRAINTQLLDGKEKTVSEVTTITPAGCVESVDSGGWDNTETSSK